MEKNIGRELRSDEIVHHIDGNKLNNDIVNLVIVTRAEHARIHCPRKNFDSHEEALKHGVKYAEVFVKE